MAEFKSRYSELGFYVDGSLRQFRNGRYVTTDKKEIAVLTKIKDVTEINKPKKETKEKAEKEAPKNSGKKSEKPAAKDKKPTKAKTSDK